MARTRSTASAYKGLGSAYKSYSADIRKIGSMSAEVEKMREEIKKNRERQRERTILLGQIAKIAQTYSDNAEYLGGVTRGAKRLGLDIVNKPTAWDKFMGIFRRENQEKPYTLEYEKGGYRYKFDVTGGELEQYSRMKGPMATLYEDYMLRESIPQKPEIIENTDSTITGYGEEEFMPEGI